MYLRLFSWRAWGVVLGDAEHPHADLAGQPPLSCASLHCIQICTSCSWIGPGVTFFVALCPSQWLTCAHIFALRSRVAYIRVTRFALFCAISLSISISPSRHACCQANDPGKLKIYTFSLSTEIWTEFKESMFWQHMIVFLQASPREGLDCKNALPIHEHVTYSVLKVHCKQGHWKNSLSMRMPEKAFRVDVHDLPLAQDYLQLISEQNMEEDTRNPKVAAKKAGEKPSE